MNAAVAFTVSAAVSASIVCAWFAWCARRDARGLRVMYDAALAASVAWRGVAIDLVTPAGLERDHLRRWCVPGCIGERDPGHLVMLPPVLFGLAHEVAPPAL